MPGKQYDIRILHNPYIQIYGNRMANFNVDELTDKVIGHLDELWMRDLGCGRVE